MKCAIHYDMYMFKVENRNGLSIYQLQAGKFIETKKLVLPR